MWHEVIFLEDYSLGVLEGHCSCESLAVLTILEKAAQSHFFLYYYLDLLLKKIQGRKEGDSSGGTATTLLSCRLCLI